MSGIWFEPVCARQRTRGLAFGFVMIACLAAADAEVDISKLPPTATRPVDFVKDIQPIFAQNCYGCHGAKKQEAAFRLDSKEVALKDGEQPRLSGLPPSKLTQGMGPAGKLLSIQSFNSPDRFVRHSSSKVQIGSNCFGV